MPKWVETTEKGTEENPACPKVGGDHRKGNGGRSSVPESEQRPPKRERRKIQGARKWAETTEKGTEEDPACPKVSRNHWKGNGGRSSVPESGWRPPKRERRKIQRARIWAETTEKGTEENPACPKMGGDHRKWNGGKPSVPKSGWRSPKRERRKIQRARKWAETTEKGTEEDPACQCEWERLKANGWIPS